MKRIKLNKKDEKNSLLVEKVKMIEVGMNAQIEILKSEGLNDSEIIPRIEAALQTQYPELGKISIIEK